MNPKIRALCQTWLDAVNQGRIEDVLALYSPDAVLLPTFSGSIRRNSESRRDYFQQLASRPGLCVSLHEKTLVGSFSGSLATASGIYRWDMEVDGEPLGFEARFSLMLDLHSSAPILHHHSSQVPRDLS